MKRKLALLLALVMVISMLPMTAFAASSNGIDRVAQVADDAEFKDAGTAPKLRIEEKNRDWGTTEQYFWLTLDNAEWLTDEVKAFNENVSVTDTVYFDNITEFSIVRRTATVAEVKVKSASGVNGDVRIPMLTEIKDDGEATVTIEARGSAVTSGTFVFANATDGKTVTTIEGTRTFGDTASLRTIQIDETKASSLSGDKEVKLILPRDFKWTEESAADLRDKIELSGGYAGYAKSNITFAYTRDAEELTIKFANLPKTSVRGTIFIDALGLEASRNARFGDVNVRVRGDVTSTELLVAKYADYGVKVEAKDDPREVFAGRFDNADNFENATHRLQRLVIKEDINDSFLATRRTTVELPNWVKIIAVDEKKAAGLKDVSYRIDGNILEFTAGEVIGKVDLELEIYVSVEADAKGDIVAEVTGRSLPDEFEVVLGKAIPAVEVDVNVTDVRVGVQRQDLGTITLTEAKAGSIQEETVRVELEEGFRFRNEPTVEVVEGDIRIDQRSIKIVGRERAIVEFTVTRESNDASVIEISDIAVDLWRDLPEGEFFVYVGGEALVNNYDGLFTDTQLEAVVNGDITREDIVFNQAWIAELPIARVITPAPGTGDVREEVKFTIGSTNFMVGNELEAMGVAPYIQNNRTFVPVTFVARALGMDRSAVVWDGVNRTVTIFGDRVVQMEIGSNVMVINGASVTMDAAPEITMDRTFVPIAHAARALGVEYTWDQATQTVTFH